MKFFEELKRRNVIKATMAYVVVAWVLIQVFTNILPAFEAPAWVLQVLMIVLAIGLPIWIVFSWVYDVTPEGLKKTESIPSDPSVTATTNKRLNILILVVLIIAVGLHFLDRPEKNEKLDGSRMAEISEDEPRQNSIAVLPFLDMSPNKDQEYYSDGIAVEILNALCKYQALNVVGRTSSFSFKDKNEDILSIGRQLKVNNILEGSVQRQNQQVRISVQLTDAGNGYTLFSETYYDSVENIFDLQSRIARDIAEKIEGELELSGNQVHARKKIKAQAYETFLRGRVEFVNGPLNMKPDEVKKAKKYFEKALELEPDFAEANAYLSLVYFNLTDWASQDDDQQRKVYLDSARLLANRAHDLDPLSPGAHLAMGSYYVHVYDWINAEKEKRKAVELNPGGAEEKFVLASFLSQFGGSEEALKLSGEALDMSPLNPIAESDHIKTLYFTRMYKDAIKRSHEAIETYPDEPSPYQFLFLVYIATKQYEKAGEAFASFLKLIGNQEISDLFEEHDFLEASKLLVSRKGGPEEKFMSRAIYYANFYAFMEDKENALNFLNEVYEKRDAQIYYMLMPHYDFLREDPRYQELYDKAGIKAYEEYKTGL